MRLKINKNNRTKNVKNTQSLKNIIARNTGIIFQRVENPIICFDIETKVRKTGISNII